ncbi:hypothetical protein AAF712_000265 [Marasmius tenuissimus]|uniref:Uncharacterized protein n=1 Tax=Marasmius tenuissimus TaxID=585030 RepID=A0ABR3AGK8_9AGAR
MWPLDQDVQPPLNPEAISSLETLYRGTPHPSPEVINIWVDFIQTKFGIRPEEVHAWLDAKQRESEDRQSEEPDTPISKQISPSSPKISSSAHSAPPQQRQAPVVVARVPEPTHPPISTNPYFPLLKCEPSSNHLLWANRDDPGPEVKNPAVPQPPRDPLRTELLVAIHEDLKLFKPPPRPSNRDALETGLAPYDETMQRFLEQANNGLLKKWGFQPESG